MKRYDIIACCGCADNDICYEEHEHPTGEWVRWDDVESLVAQIESIQAECIELGNHNAMLSRQRDAICYRLEEVWDVGPEVTGDIMSWEWVDQSQESVERLTGRIAELEEALSAMEADRDMYRVKDLVWRKHYFARWRKHYFAG